MYCTYCGNEIDNAATICDHCGKSTAENTEFTVETPTQNPVSALFIQVLSSKSFLTATVLFTAATALSFLASVLASGMATLPILNIIIIAALFLLRSRAKNGAAHFEFAGPLKALRVVTIITNVSIWVATVCFLIAGGLFLICGFVLSGSDASLNDISGLVKMDATTSSIFNNLFSDSNASFGIIFTVMAVIFLVVAVFCGILAILIYGRLAKFLKAAVLAAQTGEFGALDFTPARKAAVTHGVFQILFAFPSIIVILSPSGLFAAAAQVLLVISAFAFAKILGNIKKQ